MREDVRDFSMSRLLAKTSRVARSALKIGSRLSFELSSAVARMDS